jgi:hypothetical protein
MKDELSKKKLGKVKSSLLGQLVVVYLKRARLFGDNVYEIEKFEDRMVQEIKVRDYNEFEVPTLGKLIRFLN